MKGIMRKAAAAALAAMVLTGSMTAMAAEDSYGWQAGQQQYEQRHKVFEQAAQLVGDSAREAYLAAEGIGGDGPNSAQPHLDTEDLVEAGVIDQETADAIRQYASEKQSERHAGYAGKSSMTAEERHSFYTGMQREDADPVEELLSAGIITQEQAERITAYLQ